MLTFRRSTTAVLVLVTLWPNLVFGQATRAGIVSSLEGTVTATRVALPQPVPLKFRDDVFLQDRITTGEKSLARLLLGGAAVVTIRERSVLTITEVPGKSTIDLGAGKIGLAVARDRLRPGDQIEIRTPNAVAGVRGTVVVAEVLQATTQAQPGASAVATRFFVLRGEITAAALDAAARAPVGALLPVLFGQSFQRVGFTPPVLAPNPPVEQVVAGLQPSQPQHVEAANAEQLKEQSHEQTAALVEAITGGQGAFQRPGLLPDPRLLVYLPGNEELLGGDGEETLPPLPPLPPLRTIAAPTIRFVGPDVTFTEEELAAFAANAELLVPLPRPFVLGSSDVLALAQAGPFSPPQVTGQLFETTSGINTFILFTGEPPVLTDGLFTPTMELAGVSLLADTPSGIPLFAMDTDVVSIGGPLLRATTQSEIESARRLLDLDRFAVLAGGLDLVGSTATFTTDVVRVHSGMSSEEEVPAGILFTSEPLAMLSQGSTLNVSSGAILNVDGGIVVGSVLSATDSTVDVQGDAILVQNGGVLLPASPTVALERSTLRVSGSVLRIDGPSAALTEPLLLATDSTVAIGGDVVTITADGMLQTIGPLAQLIGGSFTAASVIALDCCSGEVFLQGPLLEASDGARVSLTYLIRDESDGTAFIDYSAIGDSGLVSLRGASLTLGPATPDGEGPLSLPAIEGTLARVEGTSLDAGARVRLQNVSLEVGGESGLPGRIVDVVAPTSIRDSLLEVESSGVFVTGDAVRIAASLEQVATSAALVSLEALSLFGLEGLIRVEDAAVALSGQFLRDLGSFLFAGGDVVTVVRGAVEQTTGSLPLMEFVGTMFFTGFFEGFPVTGDLLRLGSDGDPSGAVVVARGPVVRLDGVFAAPPDSCEFGCTVIGSFLGIAEIGTASVGSSTVARVTNGSRLMAPAGVLELVDSELILPNAVIRLEGQSLLDVVGPLVRFAAGSFGSSLTADALIGTDQSGNTVRVSGTILHVPADATVALRRLLDLGPGELLYTPLIATPVVSVAEGWLFLLDHALEIVGDTRLAMLGNAPIIAVTGTTVGESLHGALRVGDRDAEVFSGGLIALRDTGTSDPAGEAAADPDCDSCAVKATAGAIRVDQALLEATKPLIALINANLRSNGDVIHVRNGARLEMPEAPDTGVVSLASSRMLVRDGNLVTVTGSGSLLFANKLLVIDGGSHLEIRNGLLLDIADNASVVLRNCVICFNGSNNSVLVSNTIGSTELLSGVPIARAATGSLTVNSDPFPGLNQNSNTITVTTGGSLLRVGENASLTIGFD